MDSKWLLIIETGSEKFIGKYRQTLCFDLLFLASVVGKGHNKFLNTVIEVVNDKKRGIITYLTVKFQILLNVSI